MKIKKRVSEETGITYFGVGDSWHSPTSERLKYLIDTGAKYSINTDYQIHQISTRYLLIVKATLKSGDEVYTGHAQQSLMDKNWGVYAVQTAETKAIGRALGNAGIGVEFGFATYDEMEDTPLHGSSEKERENNIINELKKRQDESK